jgi:cytochrome b subunit of formate dehydrogenase
LLFAFMSIMGYSAINDAVSNDGDAHALIKGSKVTDSQMTSNNEAKGLMNKMMGIAKIFAGFVLAISVIVIVYGGLKYVLSQGDSRSAETGKMLIIYSGIGIFISLSAFIVVKMFQGFA